MPSQLDKDHYRNNARNLIDKFERDIRLFIEEELKNYYEENWWEIGIPQTIRIRISNLLNNLKKQSPKRKYKKSELFAFNDYKDIILYKKNWTNIFDSIFQEKINVSYPLKKLKSIRNDLSHARKVNYRDLRKIETYTDDIFNYIPTEFTKEDLIIFNKENQDPTKVYLSHWEEKIRKTIPLTTFNKASVPESIKLKKPSKEIPLIPKSIQTTLTIITTDKILKVLSNEWQTIKHLIFKLKIKDMMDARYLQLKLKELERKGYVLVEIKNGKKHFKLKWLDKL